jgi:hypothetical protein
MTWRSLIWLSKFRLSDTSAITWMRFTLLQKGGVEPMPRRGRERRPGPQTVEFESANCGSSGAVPDLIRAAVA